MCLQLYGPLYVGTHVLFSRKTDLKSLYQVADSIVRSSSFIANQILVFFMLFCSSRWLLGRFYYRVHAFPLSWLAAYLSLPIEKKSRHGPLAIYVANIATESLAKMMVDKGYLPRVPFAETILFTVSMSWLLHSIKKHGYGSDPISFVLKLVLGTSEAKKRVSRSKVTPAITTVLEIDDNSNLSDERNEVKDDLGLNTDQWSAESVACIHQANCVNYVLAGFAKPFIGAFAIQSALKVVKQLPKLIKQPSAFWDIRLDSRSLKFALFVGSFSGVYKSVNCYLRRRDGRAENWHGAVAGALAGPAMLFYPNTTIATYILWKTIEELIKKYIKLGYVPFPRHLTSVTYATSVSYIMYCIIFSPKYIRPSYMAFANQLCGSKLHLLNRCLVVLLTPDAIGNYR